MIIITILPIHQILIPLPQFNHYHQTLILNHLPIIILLIHFIINYA